MKTIRTILLVLAVMSSQVLWASGGLKVNFEAGEKGAALVELSSTKMSQFEVEVSDTYGEKLYSSKSEAPLKNLNRRYDFSALEDGDYLFKVKVDSETTITTLQINNGEVEAINVRKSVAPFYSHKDDLLRLSFINYQEEDVKLYVYDSKNKLLAESELGNEMAIHKAVDASELKAGKYRVVVANDWDVYEYKISIK